MATTNSAKIDDSFSATVGGLLFPLTDPLHDRAHQFVHSADGVHLLAAFTERRVYVNSSARDAHPHGAEVFEYKFHVGGLAENAHIGQDAVIDQIMGAETIAAILFALEIAPLGFFNFASHGGDYEIAFQAHSSFLQSL